MSDPVKRRERDAYFKPDARVKQLQDLRNNLAMMQHMNSLFSDHDIDGMVSYAEGVLGKQNITYGEVCRLCGLMLPDLNQHAPESYEDVKRLSELEKKKVEDMNYWEMEEALIRYLREDARLTFLENYLEMTRKEPLCDSDNSWKSQVNTNAFAIYSYIWKLDENEQKNFWEKGVTNNSKPMFDLMQMKLNLENSSPIWEDDQRTWMLQSVENEINRRKTEFDKNVQSKALSIIRLAMTVLPFFTLVHSLFLTFWCGVIFLYCLIRNYAKYNELEFLYNKELGMLTKMGLSCNWLMAIIYTFLGFVWLGMPGFLD